MWKRIGLGVVGLFGVVAAGLVGAVGYAAVSAESRLAFPDEPPPQLVASADPEVIARGEYLVRGPAHCSACHGTGERESAERVLTGPLSGGYAFAMGPLGTRYARNLTPDPTTGIGEMTDAELARAIRGGVMPDGELSIFMTMSSRLADEDLVAVISYLRSLPPVVNDVDPGSWQLFGKVLLTYVFPPLKPRRDAPPRYVAAADEPSVERGEYLLEVALCTDCHTQMDPMTFAFVGPRGGGGTPEPSHGADSDMEFAPPNLTSHPTGVTGRLDEEAFLARIRAGRTIVSSIMPWENLGVTSESDLRSIYRALRELPPVDHDNGPSYRKIGWTP